MAGTKIERFDPIWKLTAKELQEDRWFLNATNAGTITSSLQVLQLSLETADDVFVERIELTALSDTGGVDPKFSVSFSLTLRLRDSSGHRVDPAGSVLSIHYAGVREAGYRTLSVTL